ncbi:uncharacterized protein [Ptychodera flava]|uniref:uncharacterized protein n=1 Tax=Ptychodera flava TaxID=63121 RepID=UPI00396A871C
MIRNEDNEEPQSNYSKLEEHPDGASVTSTDPGKEVNGDPSVSQLQQISTDSEKSPLHLREDTFSSPCAGDGLKILIISGITFSVAVTIALVLHIILGPKQVSPHGAVSCSNAQCSQVGIDILKKEGHAVDAAIATAICLGVARAESSGIGGGGFMLVKSKQTMEAIDFRETAPADATEDMFTADPSLAEKGGLSIAVPGELKGLYTAWKKYGKLEWEELFTPAIDLAVKGFTVTKHAEEAVEKTYEDMTEGLKSIYAPNGVKVKEGETLTRPDLGKTLTLISKNEIDEFYNGNLTDNIIYTIQASGGIMSRDDLQNYEAVSKTPLESTYNGYIVNTVPVPSGGPAFMSIINILEGYNFTDSDRNKPLTYHRMVEAFKYAFAQEAELGDPDYVDNATDLQNIMMSKSAAQELRNMINDDKTYPPKHYGPYFPASAHGTSHVSVIDNEDNMVSVTLSVNDLFGSKVITPDGILLNNEMRDFSWPDKEGDVVGSGLIQSKANFIAGGKRPRSSMTPVIVYNEGTHACPGLPLAVSMAAELSLVLWKFSSIYCPWE